MLPIKIGAGLLLQIVRTVDRRLAERSIRNARLAVVANNNRGSWMQPDGGRTGLVIGQPRSAHDGEEIAPATVAQQVL